MQLPEPGSRFSLFFGLEYDRFSVGSKNRTGSYRKFLTPRFESGMVELTKGHPGMAIQKHTWAAARQNPHFDVSRFEQKPSRWIFGDQYFQVMR